MTPTDSLPARFTSPADAGQVRAVAGKAGSDESADSDGGFKSLLQRMSEDKEPAQKSGEATARSKESATARLRRLDASKAALGEMRDLQRMAADAAGPRDGDAEISEIDTGEADEADSAEGNAAAAPEKDTGASNPLGAVAMLLSMAHKRDDAREQSSAMTQQGQSGVDVDASAAAAVADKAVRDVRIVSVKVETHFAAVHTDAATTGFAQRLAMAQISDGTSAKASETGDGKLDVQAGLATQPTGEARETRGQLFAGRSDRHGADDSGAGSGKSGADGKGTAGAVRAERAAVSSATATDAAQAGATGSPLQQLSGRILATAHELQQAASATPASGTTSDAAANASAPVRVLSINLHPEDLGSVTIRMSMVAGSLDVQIDADLPDTAQMLRADSDQISDMLRSAGIQVDGLTVRAASPDTVSTSSGSGSSYFDQQSQSGGAQADGRASGGHRHGDGSQRQPERAANFGQEDENRTQRASGAGLYV